MMNPAGRRGALVLSIGLVLFALSTVGTAQSIEIVEASVVPLAGDSIFQRLTLDADVRLRDMDGCIVPVRVEWNLVSPRFASGGEATAGGTASGPETLRTRANATVRWDPRYEAFVPTPVEYAIRAEVTGTAMPSCAPRAANRTLSAMIAPPLVPWVKAVDPSPSSIPWRQTTVVPVRLINEGNAPFHIRFQHQGGDAPADFPTEAFLPHNASSKEEILLPVSVYPTEGGSWSGRLEGTVTYAGRHTVNETAPGKVIIDIYMIVETPIDLPAMDASVALLSIVAVVAVGCRRRGFRAA